MRHNYIFKPTHCLMCRFKYIIKNQFKRTMENIIYIMNILVTGGAGFIGSHLCKKLVELNYNVVIIDNLNNGNINNISTIINKIKFIKKDICTVNIDSIIKEYSIDMVYHLAAQISVINSIKDPINDINNNIITTIKILESCKKNNVKKFIFSSSGGAILNNNNNRKPLSPYGINKNIVKDYLDYYSYNYNMTCIEVLLSNVYGENQNDKRENCAAIPLFINKILNNEKISLYNNGENIRDYIYVKDVVDIFIKLLDYDKTDSIIVSTRIGTSNKELVDNIIKIIGKESKIKYEEKRRGEIEVSILNNEDTIQKFKWKPQYSLHDGLIRTIPFYVNKNS